MATVQAALANQIYITGFATDNDIYTNLNRQFPNTGPGTPRSGVGTANATVVLPGANPTLGIASDLSLLFSGRSGTADSEGWRSAFRTDVDHDSEVMPISVPN